jgi:regulator of protease activity HflC (stomatin/prohibitin superfamily)
MTTPMIRIHNSQTGEIIDREMNAEELEEAAIAKAQGDALTEAKAKAEADKAALLTRLGITAEEAALLLGGTN